MNKSLPQTVVRVSHPATQAQAVQSVQPVVVPTTQLRISLSQLTTLRWSLAEELLQLKTSSYDAIGLWRPKIAEVGEELAADMIRESGLGVSSLSFVGGFTGANGMSYDDAIADARDAILDAEQLGAENLIVVSGTRNGHTIGHSRRLLKGAMSDLADFAGLHGVRLCLLPMHSFFADSWTYLNSLDEAQDLVEQLQHPQIGLAFDTYQLSHEPRLIERIPELAAMTGVVQISDGRQAPASAAERCIPGEGTIPLGEIIRAFQRSGFDGYYDVQVWSSAGWSGDYQQTATTCREAVLRLAKHPVALSR